MKYFIALAVLLVLPITVSARGNHQRNRHTPVVQSADLAVDLPQDTSGISFTAYITSYASGDNDPAGSTVTYIDGVGGNAGGDGTYTNPITIAVGYVGSKADYARGTIFYITELKKYFIAGDTCAACHKGNGGLPWLDVYAGDYSGSGVTRFEESITKNYTIIENPNPNYEVIAGSLYNG